MIFERMVVMKRFKKPEWFRYKNDAHIYRGIHNNLGMKLFCPQTGSYVFAKRRDLISILPPKEVFKR